MGLSISTYIGFLVSEVNLDSCSGYSKGDLTSLFCTYNYFYIFTFSCFCFYISCCSIFFSSASIFSKSYNESGAILTFLKKSATLPSIFRISLFKSFIFLSISLIFYLLRVEFFSSKSLRSFSNSNSFSGKSVLILVFNFYISSSLIAFSFLALHYLLFKSSLRISNYFSGEALKNLSFYYCFLVSLISLSNSDSGCFSSFFFLGNSAFYVSHLLISPNKSFVSF